MAVTLAERLVQAEAAYHTMMIGRGITQLRDQTGEFIAYSRADPTALLAYIAWLKAQIAADADGVAPYNGPIRPFFL